MKNTLKLPAELTKFIENDNTVLHAADGDWELRIESRDDSEYGEELPARATVIAENGCGDCLFLKRSAGGKFDAKVYVYWHEEERSEVFSPNLKKLIDAKPPKDGDGKSAKPAAKVTMPLDKLEQALKSENTSVRMNAWRDFKKSSFGLEVLPMLRRLLTDDSVSVVSDSAECIARLGPEAGTCEAAEKSMPFGHGQSGQGDLENQLKLLGSKLWSYSGYTNTYCACLNALVNLGYHEDLTDYIHCYIGLNAPFDVEANFQALARIGTAEARELMKRAEAFWRPELNMAQAKKIARIVASAKSPPKATKSKKK
jgi:hypothetical protein